MNKLMGILLALTRYSAPRRITASQGDTLAPPCLVASPCTVASRTSFQNVFEITVSGRIIGALQAAQQA
jgi:hypothetical protein